MIGQGMQDDFKRDGFVSQLMKRISELEAFEREFRLKQFGGGGNSRWLPFGIYTNFNPLTADLQQPYSTSLDRTVTFVSYFQVAFVNGANNATNYWKIQLNRASDGAVIGEVSTQGLAGGVLLNLSTTTFAIPSVGVADNSIYMYVRKFLAPGNLYIFGPMVEVTI